MPFIHFSGVISIIFVPTWVLVVNVEISVDTDDYNLMPDGMLERYETVLKTLLYLLIRFPPLSLLIKFWKFACYLLYSLY